MQLLLLVHTVLLVKINGVGAVRSPPLHRLLAERPRDVLQRNRTSFKLNAGGKSVILFCFFFPFLFQRSSSSSGVVLPIESWVSWSVTSFSLDKFRGGYHNVVAFL